jgi:hypothetical protein
MLLKKEAENLHILVKESSMDMIKDPALIFLYYLRECFKMLTFGDGKSDLSWIQLIPSQGWFSREREMSFS